MSKPPMNAQPPANPGAKFRDEIQTAIQSGTPHDELLLNLTLMDASKIKRDPTIGVSDISFSEGQMRYLGVRVKQGGVSSSRLGAAADEVVEVPAAEPPPKKTRAKKAAAPRATARATAAAS